MKSNLFIFCCLMLLTVSVQAGTWTVVNDPNLSIPLEATGILIKASNLGADATAQTIDGIAYDVDYTNITGADPASNTWLDKYYSGDNAALSNLLNNAGKVSIWNPKNMNFRLSGLIAGYDYRFQLLLGGAWGGCAANLYGDVTGANNYKYVYFNNGDTPKLATYTFTAASDTIVMNTNAGSGQATHFNLAYALHELGSNFATNPTPFNGETLVPTDLAALQWDSVSNYVAVGYRVYFGNTEPNEIEANYGLTELTNGIEDVLTIDPSPIGDLAYNTVYHWVVDAYDANDVTTILHKGMHWSFTTQPEDNSPVVTLTQNGVRTFPEALPVIFDGIVNDYGEGDISLSGISWTVEQSPASLADIGITDPNVFLTNTTTNPLAPEAVFNIDSVGFDPNAFGHYVIQLTVTENADATADVLSGSDTVWMGIHVDACAAAKEANNWAGYLNVHDINKDCLVNLIDLANLAAAWLEDRSLKESLIYVD